jgi:hypothetical protein
VSEQDGTPVSPGDRQLSPGEARAYLDAPLTEAEREGVLELARWFRRRYPTPAERLAYVRRAYERWRRAQGLAARGGGVSGRDPAR